MNKRTGILLLNLGTPDSCDVSDVRSYLRTFLNDPRVIELPGVLRWLLVNCLIVPFRAKKSALAYSKIWQPSGSPLLINSLKFTHELKQKLGENFSVSLGMTYGKPSIYSALKDLQSAQVSKIIVLPLFPQYASSATGPALEQVLKIIAKYKVIPELQVKTDFFADPNFIAALSASVKPYLNKEYDYLLMSYHGLPEMQLVHGESNHCDLNKPCPSISASNASCYRAQCYHTSRLLAESLNLPADKWGVGFQSRLGRLPWIKPYTDELLIVLRSRGIKRLVVCCPSFVADCLETLEEIGIRASEQWFELGGESLKLVPCLNAQPMWINAVKKMLDLPKAIKVDVVVN